ncbi:MAG TPA: YciI family protein [Candidatus Kapabacteria bacterium]|nr:YciI family protein [Candidatus Kapabacteria bacterium]
MKEYLLIFRGNSNPELMNSPEKLQAHMGKWKVWVEELAKAGKFVGSQPLQPTGKVMEGSNVTDGPFAEGKEIISGYLIIKANDYNDAVQTSKGCPALSMVHTAEVREIQEMVM